ncbi:MAG: hypothetical protein QW520_02830 [Methanomassiliicoccales archaeon]
MAEGIPIMELKDWGCSKPMLLDALLNCRRSAPRQDPAQLAMESVA